MLDIITLESKSNVIIVSKQRVECESNDDDSIDQKEYNILNRIITIKRGTSLIYISPEYIDENELNERNIINLEFNYEISGYIIIEIYRKNSPNKIKLEFIIITEINKSRYFNINVSSFNLSLTL